MRVVARISGSFHSNCLIEAIVAKVKGGRNTKVHFISPMQNYRESKVFCPHWYWTEGDCKYWFFASHRLKWYEFLWHEGTIVKDKIEE